MPLIFEDEGKLLGKKQAKVPDKLVNKIKRNLNLFGQYKQSKGFKRASSIVDDDYNKRSNKKDKIHNGDKTLSFSDIKKIDHEYKNMSVNDDNVNAKNLGFILPGGNDMKNWAHDTLRKMRTAVKKVKSVPPVPKLEKPSPELKDINKDIKMGNATIKLTEDIEYFYDEYYDEYGPTYVFNSFLENPKGKQNWGVLINPDMYAKALREFTRFGKLTNFPSKYVYQWMGIIMKNTSILIANTDICGHGNSFPEEECEDFLKEYFGDGRDVNVYGYNNVEIEVTPEEVVQMCETGSLINEVTDKYGQTYLPWITQTDADRISAEQETRRKLDKFKETYGDLYDYIDSYNKENKNTYSNNELKIESDKIYWVTDAGVILYQIGITNYWMVLPDGSDGISDYGIDPIIKILNEFDESLPPEKVLVLVNKALDVYHCRGDLSSIFVQGGSKALTAIAESLKRRKKIIVNENQLISLKEYHDQTVFNFDVEGNPYYEKNNWENYVDFLEHIGKPGMLPASEWTQEDIYDAVENAKQKVEFDYSDIQDYQLENAFLSLIDETYVYNRYDMEDIFTDEFINIFSSFEQFKEENNYYDISQTIDRFLRAETDVFDDAYNLDNYLTINGNKLFEKIVNEEFIEGFEENGILDSMTVNDRGLIYMERTITIPNFNSPNFNYQGNNNYYNFLKKLYSDLGNCFTWAEGYGEAYCGRNYGKGGYNDITLKCWVDPKDVNWEETVYRNCYSLKDEREIYIDRSGAKVEVFDVKLMRGNVNGIDVSGKSLLKKPIIITY